MMYVLFDDDAAEFGVSTTDKVAETGWDGFASDGASGA